MKSVRVNDLTDITFTFTRTTRSAWAVRLGAVTLTGPTTVRLPVALQPLSVDAPPDVSGTGVSGSVEVPLTAGFTGDLAITTHGMAVSDTVEDGVDAADYNLECVTVTDNTSLARFSVDAVDDSADLDMHVYTSDTCDPNDIQAEVGTSATASADESVTLTEPDAGTYIVEIDGFAAGADGTHPMPYAFDFWDVDASASAGNLTVTPNPVPVVQNEATSVDLSWSGSTRTGTTWVTCPTPTPPA